MKKTIFLIQAALLAGFVYGQEFHDWKADFKIADDFGKPVENAAVTVYYYPSPQSNDSGKIEGLTDTNGVFLAYHHDMTYGLRFHVQKNGFYTTDINQDFHGVFSSNTLNHNLNLTLKKIGKPIAMYAKQIIFIKFPVYNRPVGYDLEVGDWVGPYGKGITSDFLFAENHPDANSGYTFTIAFPNPQDGIQSFSAADSEKGSDLRSGHEAPIDGYLPQYVQTQMPDQNRNYYFRVRTKVDHQGNIVSARYGKIYGDFMQFTYYLNSTSNDRNVEFDTKQNLIHVGRNDLPVKQP